MSKLPAEEQRLAQEFKSLFWDTELPWIESIKEQSDVRALITSFAALKRISNLVSCFETKLFEVENANLPPNEKAKERHDATLKFWSIYHDTANLIENELLSEAKSSNSSVEELSEPYQGLLDALNTISPEDHLSAYSADAFQSFEACRQQAVSGINPAFVEIGSFLGKTNATPTQMTEILASLAKSNSDHPEVGAIQQYQKDFKKKFKRLF